MTYEAVPKNSVGAEVTSGDRLFQRRLPATGNAVYRKLKRIVLVSKSLKDVRGIAG